MLSSAMMGLHGPDSAAAALMQQQQQQQQPGGASSSLHGKHWSAGGAASYAQQQPAMEVQYGHILLQQQQQQAPSSMLDDTFAAVMASNLGSSPLDAPPECWTDAVYHPYVNGTTAAAAAAGHGSNSKAAFGSKQLPAAMQQQQQQQQHVYTGSSIDGRSSYYSAEPTAAAGKLAGAARSSHPATNTSSDPNLMLHANYRFQHPQVFAEADRLSHSSEHTAAASAAVAQHAQLVARMQQQQLATQQAAAAVQAAAAQAAAAAASASGRSALYGAYQLPMHAQQHQQHQSMAAAGGYAQHPGYLLHASGGPGLQQQQQQYSSSSASERSSLPPRHAAAAHSSHSHPYSSAAPSSLSVDTRHATAGDASSRGGSAATAATMLTRAAAAKQQAAQAQAQLHASQAAAAATSSSGQPPQRQLALQVVPVGRFGGAVAVLEQAAATDQASMECDEDLLSMDLCDQIVPQHMLGSSHHATAAAAAQGVSHRAASGLLQAQLRQAGNARLQGGAGAMADGGGGAAAAARARASAVAAAATAAAANNSMHCGGGDGGFDACEEDEQQQFDWCGQYDQEEDSGSTHPDSDEMEADVAPQRDQHRPRYGYQQQQQQQQQAISASDSRTLLAASAATAAVEAARAEQAAVTLHVLGHVAAIRKGEAVLTAHPAAAAEAGAHSVRRRLLVTEVSVYARNASNSLLALDQSNRLMARMRLPGDVVYMPVQPDSFVFRASSTVAFNLPAFAVCLGSSYLQRMLVANPQLAYRALVCPGFEEYVRHLPNLPAELPRMLAGDEALIAHSTLRSVQFACIFLATKVADQVHALGLLRYILTQLSHDGKTVSLQATSDVEARCLETLEWRLGPFFNEDDLEGDDQELWAAAMGHWDYGTPADGYPTPARASGL